MINLGEALMVADRTSAEFERVKKTNPDLIVEEEAGRYLEAYCDQYRAQIRGKAGLQNTVGLLPPKRISNILKSGRPREGILYKVNPEALNEPMEVSDNIRNALKRVSEVTGNDASNTWIDELPDGIAGLFKLTDKSRYIDPEFLADEKLFHVILHETWHLMNKLLSDGAVIWNIDYEEALCESATAQSTGEILAYQDKMSMLDQIAGKTGVTATEQIWCFKSGENDTLNTLYQKTYMKADA